MPAEAHPDWFAIAALRCAGLPARLAIEQRLGILRVELARLQIPEHDPAVPTMIAALFPHGTASPAPLAGSGAQRVDPAEAWSKAEQGADAARAAWWRLLDWRRALRSARWLAPLLFMLLANDAPPPPETPKCLTHCPTPHPKTGGQWIKQPPLVSSGHNPEFYPALLRYALAGTAVWLLVAFALNRARRQMLRDANPDVDPLLELSLRIGRANLFAGPQFEKVLRQLRAHQASASSRLDVRRSLRATIARGGLPDLRFGTRRRKPEYLILAEREMPGDHLPEVGRALRDRLAGAQIAARQYEFTGAPWRLRADDPLRTTLFEPVEAVMARHGDARVLVCAEGEDLIGEQSSTGEWIDAIAADHRPLLLNPRERKHWHDPETRLAAAGLSVMAAGALDAKVLAQHFAQGAPRVEPASYESPQDADLPAFLAPDRDLLLSDASPESDEVEALLVNLEEHWLDRMEMRWLRTLALFPVIHPSITYFAGIALFGGDTVPLPSYLKLIRLPWFRAGTMPDWLRKALINGMDTDTFEQARQMVQAFFTRQAVAARDAQDILRLCDRSGRKRQRRRFVRSMQRSEIPALKDALLQSAFTADEPAQVGDEIGARAAAPLPRWLEVALVPVICLIGYTLFVEPRTIQIMIPRSDVWVPDKAPMPASATGPATPIEQMAQQLTARLVYAHIASQADRRAASQFLGRLAAAPAFQDAGLQLAGIEYRVNSPRNTQVRCFGLSSCNTGYALSVAMQALGIEPELNDLTDTPYGGEGKSLEIWFADADLTDTAPVQNTKSANIAPDKAGTGKAGRPRVRQTLPIPQLTPEAAPASSSRPEDSQTQNQTDASITPSDCGVTYVVYFDLDKLSLNPEAASSLDDVASTYKRSCRGAAVRVAGHTDTAASKSYSVALSERLAQTVANYLAQKGVPEVLITTQAFGSSQLRVPTAQGVREQANRRVEITFEMMPTAN